MQRHSIALAGFGVSTSGLENGTFRPSVQFRNPDGRLVELATRGSLLGVDALRHSLRARLIVPDPRASEGHR